ncbi:uncharacterized protein BYT42DRAFT_542227 [Radiomyces spectabilis]|uniref:uncharacterized protein n=1 Tax=Radiomyces spectabilis TaxID=64574 RepID=UPI00222049F3|nr:uncharacterized protein BYT42DRAFT_542227 [Radiomyces spectabilis]KAI8394057.1 hypothetical protein BYT42DRAFT_542227 [Radiomyces spectabilis]
MPSLTSRLFGNDKSSTTTCSCGCHPNYHHNPITTFSPPKWFPLIRRRSSASSTSSAEVSMHDKESLYDELRNLFRLAEDEMAYAIESQGSIYYNGDLCSAREAVSSCLSQYHRLHDRLNKVDSLELDSQWADTLVQLRMRLDALPLA